MDYLLAFSAGLLSFLSPCVLPLIPVYLSYIIGSSLPEMDSGKAKLNAGAKSVFFIIGFSLVFIVLGVSVSSISKLFAGQMVLIRQVGGILIIIFGLHMIGLFKIKFLYAQKRFMPSAPANKTWNSFLLGMAFAAGWTPCIGPILSTILIYAGSMDTIEKGVLLLALYSLGMGLPFFLSALLVDRLTLYLKKLSRYIPAIHYQRLHPACDGHSRPNRQAGHDQPIVQHLWSIRRMHSTAVLGTENIVFLILAP
ncbi:cytochrome c-type biogenesis protein [Paenibacillus endophyticus]|uniref:Cytochrome c-type biogenesis protein n=1 Tax=Paenibacillus endophyticus TaxID=1294268 RepID=A0A7W5C2W0_9BACL|nr:cytochrome c biogenesis protein CcdA [Paenibacillus endophyticus]MBB3150081.1 cytochrome c-type biogenesis protein [Paenibacillus endophyticus]